MHKMCYFPCKCSETSYTAREANWDQGLLKGGRHKFSTNKQRGTFFFLSFSDHAEHFIKHRYKKPKHNLWNFGFHLGFNFIIALQQMTYFCVSYLLEFFSKHMVFYHQEKEIKTFGSQSRLFGERQMLDENMSLRVRCLKCIFLPLQAIINELYWLTKSVHSSREWLCSYTAFAFQGQDVSTLHASSREDFHE